MRKIIFLLMLLFTLCACEDKEIQQAPQIKISEVIYDTVNNTLEVKVQYNHFVEDSKIVIHALTFGENGSSVEAFYISQLLETERGRSFYTAKEELRIELLPEVTVEVALVDEKGKMIDTDNLVLKMIK